MHHLPLNRCAMSIRLESIDDDLLNMHDGSVCGLSKLCWPAVGFQSIRSFVLISTVEDLCLLNDLAVCGMVTSSKTFRLGQCRMMMNDVSVFCALFVLFAALAAGVT
jgi:hypothetical protein